MHKSLTFCSFRYALLMPSTAYILNTFVQEDAKKIIDLSIILQQYDAFTLLKFLAYL